MSYHDKEKHPKYNTNKIHAGLALHGMTFKKPSMMSDAFRIGYITAIQNMSKREFLVELRENLDLNLSNLDETKEIISRIEDSTDLF